MDSVYEEKKCLECGHILAENEEFCPKCGIKYGEKILIITVSVIALAGIIFAGNFLFRQITISVDELIAQEKYSEAYNKANETEKNNVINHMIEKNLFKEAYEISGDENIVITNELAYYCKSISDGLKDSKSFFLKNVYYDGNDDIVFTVNGSNSYGASVVGYYYYTFNNTQNKYVYKNYLSSLEQEKTYSWDSSSEIKKKLLII